MTIHQILNQLQLILDFQGFENNNPQFQKNGIGKIATAAFILGTLFGLNICVAIVTYTLSWYFSSVYIIVLCVWCTYITFLSSYHFLEFFITAIKQPMNVTYQSFVIDQSKQYTLAACKFIL